jgi:hypothetical protein
MNDMHTAVAQRGVKPLVRNFAHMPIESQDKLKPRKVILDLLKRRCDLVFGGKQPPGLWCLGVLFCSFGVIIFQLGRPLLPFTQRAVYEMQRVHLVDMHGEDFDISTPGQQPQLEEWEETQEFILLQNYRSLKTCASAKTLQKPTAAGHVLGA